MMASVNTNEDSTDTCLGSDRSLAGEYVVSINDNHWSLFHIEQVSAGRDIVADGARAAYSLLEAESLSSSPEPDVVITVKRNNDNLLIASRISSGNIIDNSLIRVLERIIVQWAVQNSSQTEDKNKACTVTFANGSAEGPIDILDTTSVEGAIQLFADVLGETDSGEWVEMVTGNGMILGKVPRKLVHKYNLLHRGIGLFVSKDISMQNDMQSDEQTFPDLYVHRRAADKRIFPSLYDMFVGGVSLADEEPELTARREVAEELGLSSALERGFDDGLAGPILDCVVCTAYNRCFVTLYTYVMDTTQETVTWQEEEVDWGQFVPYPIIVAAADRSIQRFANGEKWPGSYPPIQSSNGGTLKTEKRREFDSTAGEEWKDWDFVPDGLLVWEAWLKFIGAEHRE